MLQPALDNDLPETHVAQVATDLAGRQAGVGAGRETRRGQPGALHCREDLRLDPQAGEMLEHRLPSLDGTLEVQNEYFHGTVPGQTPRWTTGGQQ